MRSCENVIIDLFNLRLFIGVSIQVLTDMNKGIFFK